MRSAFLQHLLTALCLLTFVLSQTVFTSIGVRCRNSSGAARIEIACIKSAPGACVSPAVEPHCCSGSTDPSADAADHAPCEDEPLSVIVSASKVMPIHGPPTIFFPSIVIAVLTDAPRLACELQAFRLHSIGDGWRRPPDELPNIRSIVLIV